MINWFECGVSYDKLMENGTTKRVTEPYLVDAMSFTEAEARIIEELKPFITGEFLIKTIKRANISELFFFDGGDLYFKAEVLEEYDSADLSGKVFEEMIQKYGLPNMNAPICTRNLKTYTIKAYMRQQGFKKYYNAIGIRIDEVDRVNPNYEKERIIYPLISMFPTKKTDVNQFWINQDFDLQLKSYEGNCDCCFKKSLRKLLTIAQENPQLFDWWQKMEQKYENYIPDSIKRRNHKINLPIRIFRNNLSVAEIIEMSQSFTDLARDESKDIERYKQLLFFNFELDTPNGCSESCEAF